MKTTIDSAFLWFNEMEAAWAFSLNDKLDELYIHPDILNKDINKKYEAMLLELNPDLVIGVLDPKMEILNEAQHFPKLEDLFGHGLVKSLYQPIVDTNEKTTIHGVECLSRFIFEDRSLSPEYVFNYAQEKLETANYDKSCIELALSQASKLDGLIFVNVRPQTLLSLSFSSWLLALIKKYELTEEQLVLEVTEQHCHISLALMRERCQELSSLGLRFAIDDFGSGLANLSLLELIKPAYLKISGRFSKNIHRCLLRQRIIKNILDLAQSFQIEAVVECVESEEEWREIKRLGATLAQGFYFFHPMPFDEMKKL